MSVSITNATTGTMAAAAAIAQAQAVQYTNHFASLKVAVDSGDPNKAKQALAVFQKDSAVATANGYDPVTQTAARRQDFSTLKKAVSIGDIRTAKTALSNLLTGMGLDKASVPASSSTSANIEAGTASRAGVERVASATSSPAKTATAVSTADDRSLTGSDLQTIRDIRSIQSALTSTGPQKTSNTFIKPEPQLSSFSQAPQVFPTFSDTVNKLTLNSTVQAVVQGIGLSMPGGQPSHTDGTSFAPTPELILGSKGMTIPPGADVRMSRDLVLLKGLSVS
jgi:hypothetical protein